MPLRVFLKIFLYFYLFSFYKVLFLFSGFFTAELSAFLFLQWGFRCSAGRNFVFAVGGFSLQSWALAVLRFFFVFSIFCSYLVLSFGSLRHL